MEVSTKRYFKVKNALESGAQLASLALRRYTPSAISLKNFLAPLSARAGSATDKKQLDCARARRWCVISLADQVRHNIAGAYNLN